MLSFLHRLAVVAILFTARPCHASRPHHSLRSQQYNPRGHVNAAYFINWGIRDRGFYPQDMNVSHISHVLYAFLGVEPDGTVYSKDEYADYTAQLKGDSYDGTKRNAYGCVKQLFLLKKSNRHLKTLLSIGGSGAGSANFSSAASTPDTRARFASTSVSLMRNWGFDGIDIDWEYPDDEIDAANLVSLLKAIRIELDAYARNHASGHHFLLSIAAPAAPEHYLKLQLKHMGEIVDHINLMAYDYSGGWDYISGHNANLFPYKRPVTKLNLDYTLNESFETAINTHYAIMHYLRSGVRAEKIVLGIPVFGRSFEDNSGLGKTFYSVGKGSWGEPGVWDYKALPKEGAAIIYDPIAHASFSYDERSRELISYDTQSVVEQKAAYVVDYGLGGSMFWEASADKQGDGSLIGTSYRALGSLETTPNWLDYKNSYFENIATNMGEGYI
ncbi:endochitinase [Fusarium tjaetaba]|uniref:chitinase n=1 Tax=Fusarium tjaetaba TaxID=1567544 RepID=A0A8H5QHW1_9HYPO|nr:endochitinase [Fusarium tjaetaba]KAF5614812.1 endochitinase [Fusarium tjaetaba]